MKRLNRLNLGLLIALAPACADDTAGMDTDGASTGEDDTTAGPMTTVTPTTVTPDTGDTAGDTMGMDTTAGDTMAMDTTAGDTMSMDTTAGEDTMGMTDDTAGTTEGDTEGDTEGTTEGTAGTTSGVMCGDGVAEGDEECDMDDLAGGACPIVGDISCADDCTYDMTECTDVLTVCSVSGAAIDSAITTEMAPLVDTITIAEDFFVTDVNVPVTITHTYAADVVIDLLGPAMGADASLTDGTLCLGPDDFDCVFDDEMGVAPACGVPAFDGPISPVTALSSLIGVGSMGDWSVSIWDDTGGDEGTLDEWCVELTLSDVDPVTCGDNTTHFGETCDGTDLGGLDCTDFMGFLSGDLACADDCQSFDTTMCSADPPQGDTCGDAFIVDAMALPYMDSNDSLLFANDYGYSAGACAGNGGAGNNASADVAYEFTPVSSGVYTIDFAPMGYDGTVYIVSSCDDVDGTCVAAGDTAGDGLTDSLTAELDAGTTYYILGGSFFNFTEGTGGPYTLTVSDVCVPACDQMACGQVDATCGNVCGCNDGDVCTAGTCTSIQVGDTCGDPFPIDETMLPFTDMNDTSTFQNDYGYSSGDCPGTGGGGNGSANDVVYELTPDTTGVYTISLDSGYDTTVYVVTDCDDIGNSCVRAADAFGTSVNPEEVVTNLDAGTTYFIVAGGDGSTDGAYTLDVSAACIPACDQMTCDIDDGCGGTCGCTDPDVCVAGTCGALPAGDTCGDPRIVGALPYSDTGDTDIYNNNYGYGDGVCPGETGGWNNGAEEVVYSFTPAADGDYEFTLTADTGWDSTIWIVTDCDDIDNTCVGGEDNTVGTPEVLTATLTGGTTYFVMVGHFSDTTLGNGGGYTLDIVDVTP
ncbi:MAG: hypothetical protein AAF721_23010 [Myxococcota bacterium]